MRAEHVASAARPEQFPPESLPEVAFLGRSNVGKSSLLNALVGQRGLAFTSSSPGRTQVINFYRVDGNWCFVDLPGYGYARVPEEVKARWKRLIDSYLLHRRTLELAVVLIDARRGWMETDLQLKCWLDHHKLPYLIVVTKTDKLNRKEEQRGLTAIRGEMTRGEPLLFSAVTGRGVREIWQTILKTRSR
ncbi:MAG: YihA family ribosome biogenesis GTP-binding protein [Acidobacteria bacterium]|nr:YihA family ribosome biogenesis GTP-binding protein [Acidobacteriota bacterium]MBI3278860.1 YihA family ribosome biogenesis GTP-binding protein [Acidobacteriota bacterium]